jgi:hypothetical protein
MENGSVKLGLSNKNKQPHTSNSSILLTSLPSTKNDDMDSHSWIHEAKEWATKKWKSHSTRFELALEIKIAF